MNYDKQKNVDVASGTDGPVFTRPRQTPPPDASDLPVVPSEFLPPAAVEQEMEQAELPGGDAFAMDWSGEAVDWGELTAGGASAASSGA